MLNLRARTELNDSWANVALAEVHLKRGDRHGAQSAIADAERHFKNARSAIEEPGQILDKLTDLRNKLNQIQSGISQGLATRTG
jgi:hypothetical protein